MKFLQIVICERTNIPLHNGHINIDKLVELDNADLMISKPNDHIPFDKSTFTGSFYFNTDNVDEIWNTVKDKIKICYPIESFEYGMREFAVYDNNDYLLQFGQDIVETVR